MREAANQREPLGPVQKGTVNLLGSLCAFNHCRSPSAACLDLRSGALCSTTRMSCFRRNHFSGSPVDAAPQRASCLAKLRAIAW
jgi:hypothetical protein